MTSLLRELMPLPMPAVLEDDRLAAGQRERARGRQADDAGADHDGIDAVHGGAPALLPGRRRSVAVARQLAIEDAHHRLEEQALAIGARMGVVGVRRLDARGDLVGEHLERPAGAQREHLVAADALEPAQPPVRLATVAPVTRTPWFFMKTTGLPSIAAARRAPSSRLAAMPQ